MMAIYFARVNIVPLSLLVACFAAAVPGSLLASSIRDLRLPFDLGTGLCAKASHAFELKARFSHCVWGLARAREGAEFCPFMFI